MGVDPEYGNYGIECKSGIEVSELAARFFKKPSICGRGFAESAAKVGVCLKESPSLYTKLAWGAKVFSEEPIKSGIQVEFMVVI